MGKLPSQGVGQGAAALGRGRIDASSADDFSPIEGVPADDLSVSDVDRLRMAIVTDEKQHGAWLRLTQYGPLPKRIAFTIASSWRRAKPKLFDGDRHFRARLVPVTSDGSRHRLVVVRSETLYAVEVSYPGLTDENK